ncbi:histidine--tRNA ligase [Candidatus Parcubacteria bacterium]|nr:histidine--tRNA ligase [Candidatus Parcubacteria bacterium]
MSKLSTDSYKGVRDFYPEEQAIQNYIFKIWRKTLESFGYQEYGASILEPSEIYKEKSGEEIVKSQTYTFKDRGDREVTLRPEMTPSIARMVAAKRRELGFPLRWYSIPNLFRYEAPQRGRLREHWQLNADIFGVDGIEADVEIITLAYRILIAFGASDENFEIRLNSYAQDEGESLSRVIDRLKDIGITNIKIDSSLKRGQAYYTGVVFEFFDTNKENTRSILGGGRFDNITALFGEDKLSAAGFGMGDVTTKDFLQTHNLLPKFRPTTDLYIALTSLDLGPKAEELGDFLRMNNVNVAIDWSGKKVSDQVKSANKQRVPYALVLGEDEVKSGMYSVKKMETGKEIEASKAEIIDIIKQ